jgi:hypothetical protein
MGHLYLAYRISFLLDSKDISQGLLIFFKVDRPKSRSLGQKFWDSNKELFIMHLYLKYESPTALGSKDIVQIKGFSKLGQISRSSSIGHQQTFSLCICVTSMKALQHLIQKI